MNKYQYDTYEFYETRPYPVTLRAEGFMKDPVDGHLLEEAAQKTISRYPYFSVKLIRNGNHYEYIKNDLPIAVYSLENDHLRTLGTEESNYHLLNVDYQGKMIGLNMVHALTGGQFFMYLFYTLLYEYVRLRYDADAAPGSILTSGSSMLPGENKYPDTDLYRELSDPVHSFPKDGFSPLADPVFHNQDGSLKQPAYYKLRFSQKEVMDFSRKNDCSPNSFLSIMMGKAMDRTLPPEADSVSACIMQNYSGNVGTPDTRYGLVNTLYVVYPRSALKRDYGFLGTITRGQIILQSDIDQSVHAMKKEIRRMDEIDRIEDFEEKHQYASANCRFKEMPQYTYEITYPGRTDLGDLPLYTDGIYALTAPFLFMTILAFGDQIQVTYQQPGTDEKYLSELLNSFDHAGVSCQVEGPCTFLHPVMQLPTEKN